jgi:hypothetical protein
LVAGNPNKGRDTSPPHPSYSEKGIKMKAQKIPIVEDTFSTGQLWRRSFKRGDNAKDFINALETLMK